MKKSRKIMAGCATVASVALLAGRPGSPALRKASRLPQRAERQRPRPPLT